MKFPPLIIDLDGTLVLTDTLYENVIDAIKKDASFIFKIPFALLKGKAEFKKFVYDSSAFHTDHLPYRGDLLDYIKQEKSQGRSIILATAAYEKIAEKVSEYIGLFDKVIATNDQNNLKGNNKLKKIISEVGDEFIYAGDHSADIEIWQAKECKGAIICGKNASYLSNKVIGEDVSIIKIFEERKVSTLDWLKAIRIHQWLKNILIFIPLFLSFLFLDIEQLTYSFLAFLAFSIGASATYILNDLWDLNNDRQHLRKCKRPFASGRISILSGVKVALMFLIISLSLSYYISYEFLFMVILYLVTTTIYSLSLKKKVLIDIVTLSILYTTRIIAGGIVNNIAPSYWLISFSILIFISLAAVKRCAELVSMKEDDNKVIIGRGYMKSDLSIMYPLGISSYIGAIILYGLYINDPITRSHYHYPNILWICQLLLFYLIGNLWISVKRGKMHDDPLVYLVRDKTSIIFIAIIVFLTILAYYGF